MQLLNTQFMSFSQKQQLLIQKTQLLLNTFTRRQLKKKKEQILKGENNYDNHTVLENLKGQFTPKLKIITTVNTLKLTETYKIVNFWSSRDRG